MVALVSVVLAVGSGAVLVSREDNGLGRLLARTYDTAELFLRDTIRLTFKSRSIRDTQEVVFVAPLGILNRELEFNWTDDVRDLESLTETDLSEPTAPVRLLDPAWQPLFSGLPQDKES